MQLNYDTKCRKETFLDDPITQEYGVGAEMVGLIDCDCPECQQEKAELMKKFEIR